MESFLALPPAERTLAFQEAGRVRGLAAGSVEKDFWVCLVLRELFTIPAYADQLTFKGGTSLSKAWELIDRFSEDIDLTIERDTLGFGGDDGPEAATSGKERERRLRGLRKACRELIAEALAPALRARLQALLPKSDDWSLVPDGEEADGQTLLFAYPRPSGADALRYVKPVVKLEFGARSDPWPVAERKITSIVAEQFPQLFDAPSSIVRALLPERTFWEKVMLLHEERFRPADRVRRPRMARHYYDVWRLIDAGVAQHAAAQIELFERVAAHRELYFRSSWVDYSTLKRGTIQMLPSSEQLDEWRGDYSAMRQEMFVGNPPQFDDILSRIEQFQSEFNSA